MKNVPDNDQPIKVGLLWHSVNSDNLGVGALTLSNISIIEKVAADINRKVEFVIVGWQDPSVPYVSGENIRFFPMKAKHMLKPDGIYKTFKQCDLVFDISAGDSFADIYGVRRCLFNCLAKINVVLARRRLILSPQTIGPFDRWWTKLLAGFLMRRAYHVIARDNFSTDYLKTFKSIRKMSEATDVAFRLPFEKSVTRNDENVHFGLNVSGLLFNGGYSEDNMFSLKSDYRQLIRSLITELAKVENCKVHLIGHVNSHAQEVEDDYRVAERLGKEFSNTVVAPRFKSPSDAKSYIAQMDFFSGSRMHACIAAFSSGVPVVPMAYSRKFAGLFGTLGYHHMTDCKTQTSEEIISAVMDGFTNRHALKRDLTESLVKVDQKLKVYEDIISNAFKENQ